MQTIKVMWDGINELDLMTLTEMGKDGYLPTGSFIQCRECY